MQFICAGNERNDQHGNHSGFGWFGCCDWLDICIFLLIRMDHNGFIGNRRDFLQFIVVSVVNTATKAVGAANYASWYGASLDWPRDFWMFIGCLCNGTIWSNLNEMSKLRNLVWMKIMGFFWGDGNFCCSTDNSFGIFVFPDDSEYLMEYETWKWHQSRLKWQVFWASSSA